MPWPASSKVLVVDDDIHVRCAISLRLVAAGHSVLQADSAEAALAILQSRSDIALLCTDIEMPGSMDGIALAAAAQARWPQVKVLVISGRAAPENASIAGEFISKEKGAAAIVSAIEKFLRPASGPVDQPACRAA